MMAPSPRPLPALLRRVSPETLAVGLAGSAVAALAIGTLLIGAVAQPAPGATADPSATTRASAAPTATAAASPSAVNVAVQVLLDANVTILGLRSDIETAVTASDAPAVARHLRRLNPLLDDSRRRAATVVAPSDPSLARTLTGIYESTHDASTATLRDSITASDAIVAGGRRVLELLQPLAEATRELAALAGVSPPPEAVEGSPAPEP